MQDIRAKIVQTLDGTSSQQPMSFREVCLKMELSAKDAQKILDILYDDKVINQAVVTRGGLTQNFYWLTAKALTPNAWGIFTISKKPDLPPPARRNELLQTKPTTNEANDMPKNSRSDHIRNTITNNPGIAHDELIIKTAVSEHPAELKKAADLIEHVMRQGGFERTNDIRSGAIIRRYYTKEAWQQRLESAKQVVESTIPTLEQRHDATPPVKKQPAEPVQQALDPCAIIEIKFAIQLPDMPDRLKLTGLRKSSLDDAIASGDGYMIDVATLDDNAVESLCAQWAQKFKAHVQARKQLA